MADLKGRMARLVTSDESTFDNPYSNDTPKVRVSDLENLSTKRNDDDEYRPKKKKKSKLERIIETGTKMQEQLYQDEAVEAFDSYLSDYAMDDEDLELRQALIAGGRKYARETKVSQESSEIIRAFSGKEKMLNEIIDDVSTDIDSTQKDISQMRAMRTGRNTKVLSEMISNKKELYQVKLSAIKELNAMTKTQIELQAKANKEKALNDSASGGDSDALINRAIGSLIGNGRSSALGTVGGYGGVSGARGADEDYGDMTSDDYDEDDDRNDYEEEDPNAGRNYLKYEGMGISLVTTEQKDGSYIVHAEDRDGNVVPDYPLPTNANHQRFNVNERLGTATDDYHRKYIYRKAEE